MFWLCLLGAFLKETFETSPTCPLEQTCRPLCYFLSSIPHCMWVYAIFTLGDSLSTPASTLSGREFNLILLLRPPSPHLICSYARHFDEWGHCPPTWPPVSCHWPSPSLLPPNQSPGLASSPCHHNRTENPFLSPHNHGHRIVWTLISLRPDCCAAGWGCP